MTAKTKEGRVASATKASKKAAEVRSARSCHGEAWAEKSRQKIRDSNILHRLITFAEGGVDQKTKEPIELNATQLRAMEICLKKCLPDLSNVEISGNGGSPIQIIISGKDAEA